MDTAATNPFMDRRTNSIVDWANRIVRVITERRRLRRPRRGPLSIIIRATFWLNGGALSAVVDTDFAIVGDAGLDLVMLALTSLNMECEPGVRSRLFAEAFNDLDELRAQAYLGHLFVRLIDWPIRRNSPKEVDFWLARADELLTF